MKKQNATFEAVNAIDVAFSLLHQIQLAIRIILLQMISDYSLI